MSEHHYAVILAGGKGERFWPLSTSRKPKQLLSLVADESLLAQAVDRLQGLVPPERVLVITNDDLLEASRAAAPALPPENIIGEPIGRDTAAAVALAAALVKAKDPKAAFCILTADHVIGEHDLFRRTLRVALDEAVKSDVLLTIGIRPAEPSTAYGYVESGEVYVEAEGITVRRATRFVEKPDRPTAEQYVASGNFFWNSGMFIWSVKAIELAMQRHVAPLADMMERLVKVAGTTEFTEALRLEYEGLEKISIDYAIMEKADNILMAVGTFPWDDVGSWTALANHFPEDAEANVVVGEGSLLDARANIVVSRDHLTAVVGVDNLVVVQAPGVTLVCPKERVQDVKAMVAQLRTAGRHDEVL